MPEIGVGAADPGESLLQVSASQVFLHYLVYNRTKEPLLFLTMLIMAGFERFIVVVQDRPQVRIAGLSRMVDRKLGRQ